MGLSDREWMKREPSNSSRFDARPSPAAVLRPGPRVFTRGFVIFITGFTAGTAVQVLLRWMYG